VHPAFAVPERFHIAGIGRPVEEHEAFRHQQDIVDRRHMTLYLGLLGLVLGGALGRLLGGCWPEKVLAATSAAIGGYLAAVSASFFYVAMRDRVGQGDLLHPFLRQLMIGVPLGASLGLGLMMRSGSWRAMGRGLVAGAIGGVLFSAAYTLIVAIGLPEANTESLLPEESLTRLVWLTTLAGCLGLTTSFAVSAAPPSHF
jgi:hypothetical protein